ncbi:MAG: 23S rRNA (adenine(2503)-C(2))-methyltransferase RlmN [Phycisphaerae bacterium]|nr:23S rRNA (adenine(2503)-C(2))-methyltransferase RlmN [Phycisphaerae bacterium]
MMTASLLSNGITGALAAGVLPTTRVRVDGGATKFCLRTADGYEIESVIVPMGAQVGQRDKTWRTLCVSSQIGCAWGCRICHTARIGLIRDLTVEEIVGQVDVARTRLGADVRNVVFMGMGEPLDNFDNMIGAIRRWHEDREHQIPRRRVTVSTVGRCEGIRRLGALRWRRLNLAVSLNAPNDEIRSRIMPINRVEPMGALREAIRGYPVRGGGHVLIEYVLIKGVNDRPEHARQLVEYLKGLRTCVNLIPYNPCGGLTYEAPSEEAVAQFQAVLMEAGQLVFRRNTKGQQAMAACGQLGNLNLRRKP